MSEPLSASAPPAISKLPGKVMGTLHDDDARIYVRGGVLKSILDFSETDTRREVGGFLLGEVTAAGRIFVEVAHFLAAQQTRSGAASLTFTHDTWAELNREVAQRFPDYVVVGWHHTHPRLGIFLSGYDQFIHRNFFGARWQIAMVVDPLRREFGFFQWRGDQVVDCGFVYVA